MQDSKTEHTILCMNEDDVNIAFKPDTPSDQNRLVCEKVLKFYRNFLTESNFLLWCQTQGRLRFQLLSKENNNCFSFGMYFLKYHPGLWSYKQL